MDRSDGGTMVVQTKKLFGVVHLQIITLNFTSKYLTKIKEGSRGRLYTSPSQ